MLMATLQVKNVPDDLYAKARQRAAAQGLTLSQLVLQTLEQHLELPTMEQWLERVDRREREALTHPTHEDVLQALDDAKAEIDEGR